MNLEQAEINVDAPICQTCGIKMERENINEKYRCKDCRIVEEPEDGNE